MSIIKNIVSKLLKTNPQLSVIEKTVFDCVKSQLDINMAKLWDAQVQSINKIQRLLKGVEVNFYRMKSGQPSFPEELSFPNKTEELLLAKVQMKRYCLRSTLIAEAWCVAGFLFSIEYAGSVGYFEKIINTNSRSKIKVSCELLADLASTHNLD